MPPGLYLHVPFCATVCPYCDFAVLVGDADRRERFVEALIGEIRLWEGKGRDLRGFDTIYFGGGTPSMLEPDQLGRILEAIASHLEPAAGARIFVEANPEDVAEDRLRDWLALGAGTLSLGVQSFDDGELAFLGRAHTPDQGRRAVERARAAGFDTVSIDLIYGLPEQSADSWRRCLETAVALEPDHLSCYQLTIHPGTAFEVRRRRGELSELPDDDQADLFMLTHRFLSDAGYPGYEACSFARSESHRSAHNSKYWDHTPYLGLGPSAHSFDGRRRWWNRRQLGPWQASIAAGHPPVEASEELGDRDLARERVMLGLRTYAGFDGALLEKEYGFDLVSSRSESLERLVARGKIIFDGSTIRPTLAGLAVADAIARELSP